MSDPLQALEDSLNKASPFLEQLTQKVRTGSDAQVANGWPENEAIEVWEKEGIVFSVIEVGPLAYRAPYNGYCRFPGKMLSQRYDGIATWIPVHGGITFYGDGGDKGVVYGFDCGHAGDEDDSTLTLEWVKAECERMAEGVLVALSFEPDYLATEDNELRIQIVQQMHDKLAERGISFDIRDNFNGMLSILTGKV